MRAFLFAALMLAACASAPAGGGAPAPDTSNLPQHIREDLAQRDIALREPGIVVAGLNQTADLGGGLRVRPLEVVEDSRCPRKTRAASGPAACACASTSKASATAKSSPTKPPSKPRAAPSNSSPSHPARGPTCRKALCLIASASAKANARRAVAARR